MKYNNKGNIKVKSRLTLTFEKRACKPRASFVEMKIAKNLKFK